jgi:type IV pilus assembly protein PilY1
VPGLVADTGISAIDGKTPSFGIPVWRRRSWRTLNNAD